MNCEIAIVGAGPYGLAAAAHLRAAGAADVRVFGRPMSFWREHMPAGMFLRSPFVASSISSPDEALSIAAFHDETVARPDVPVPLTRFVEYGTWFQQRIAPDVDPRAVRTIERDDGGFRLAVEDGDVVTAARVVVAAGIEPFAHRPSVFAGTPAELVSHTSEHRDLSRFDGRRVLVVGGGQSALETAALVHEAGAEAELLVRAPGIHWLGQHGWLRELGPVSTALYAPQEVGPPLLCQLVAAPAWFGRVPRRVQDRMHTRSIRPAGAGWLRPRVEGVVPITTGATVTRATARDGRIEVEVDDGRRRVVDHVLLGTGFRVDITRYPFLAPALLRHVRRVGGYPVLGAGLESSVPGLHFLGAPAAWSYGPLMRFVAGTPFAAGHLARTMASRPTVVAGG